MRLSLSFIAKDVIFYKICGNSSRQFAGSGKAFLQRLSFASIHNIFTIKDNGSGIKLKCFRNFQMCCVSLKANVSLMECNTCYCAQAI